MADEEETPEESAENAEESATLDLKGHRLDEMGGAQVGKIEGRIVSDAHGGMEWLLARMGRFGHYCLVPGRDGRRQNRHRRNRRRRRPLLVHRLRGQRSTATTIRCSCRGRAWRRRHACRASPGETGAGGGFGEVAFFDQGFD